MRSTSARFTGVITALVGRLLALGQIGSEPINTKDIQHPLEVVAQHHQAEFTVDRFAATDEKVIPATPALEGAEGVLSERFTLLQVRLTHHCHPSAQFCDQISMFGSIQLPIGFLLGQTA